MTFYLKPPRNRVFLHSLRSSVSARVEYFLNYSFSDKNASAYDFEYLITDSPLDRIGHFMLR